MSFRRFAAAWPYGVLAALALIGFERLIFSGLILGRGDVYSYFYPYWAVRNAALLSGRLPLWSPDLFMGVPLLANSQLGTFYPPNWLITPLFVPTGVTFSLLLHLLWALIGAYRLGRRALGLAAAPALAAAGVFGLGGYLGGKVENINQFQALAWLPWLFLLADAGLKASDRRARLRHRLQLAGGLALQLLAGHPQTVFITGLGLVVYGLLSPFAEAQRSAGRRLWAALSVVGQIGLAGAGALLLAVPQLLPTLELIGSSNRSGGLNPQQAMAFSLNPLIIGRGLLPSYDGWVFGEYVAYIGVVGLGLAVVGALAGGRARWRWVGLLLLGIGLALGLYNPLYWPLAGLPGFNFFRVPARWLALAALAAAMLAGLGLQALFVQPRIARRVWLVLTVVIAGLAAAAHLADRTAADVIGPALPTERTLTGWGLAAAALAAGLTLLRWRGARAPWSRALPALLGAAAVIELLAAARTLPYNELIPPDSWSAGRFTIHQLQAFGDDERPPGRILSISQLLFDPGDLDALTARYRAAGLSERATRLALVTVKQREVLSPNLPLVWGVPSIDGFDGGLLPTGWYTQFTSLLLPPGELRTIDGRLRELLARPDCRGACLPDQRWLNLTNARYLITDKVYDLWHEDVAYDTQFEMRLMPGEMRSIRDVPAFEATALDILYACDEGACAPPAAEVTPAGGGAVDLMLEGEPAAVGGFWRARLAFVRPAALAAIRLAGVTPVRLRALTLVDERTDDFQQLTLGPWRRRLSSDIKLYENLDVLPRAFIVTQVLIVPDTWEGGERALQILRDPAFDPAQMAVIHGDAPAAALSSAGGTSVDVSAYTPERIELEARAPSDAYLILTDAYYPGWTAEVNGQPAPVYRANVMFRAVRVPAGASRVTFSFQPGWWPWPFVIGGLAWLGWAIALAVSRRPRP